VDAGERYSAIAFRQEVNQSVSQSVKPDLCGAILVASEMVAFCVGNDLYCCGRLWNSHLRRSRL